MAGRLAANRCGLEEEAVANFSKLEEYRRRTRVWLSSELSENSDADARVNPVYTCDRCGASFETPQLLRDHEESHIDEGDEEVQEEWLHTPQDPEEAIPSLGGDTNGDTV